MTPMPDTFNLSLEIGKVAHEYGEHPCIIAHDITLTYKKFWQITCSFASKMRDLGIVQNSFVMVRTRDLVASLATLHATALLGASYAPYDPKIIVGNLPDLPPPDFLFHTPDEPADPIFPSVCITPDWINRTLEPNHTTYPGFEKPDSRWLLVNTSGTTGVPKYLWLTAHQIMLRTKASQDDFEFGKTRFGGLFPCNSRPFFARANAALLSAAAIVDTIDVEFLQQNCVDLFCGSPRTAIEWLGGRTIEPKLPLIQVSGARLEPEYLRTLLRSFHVVEDVYGASETSKTHVNRIVMTDGKLVSQGRMLDSIVELIGEDGNQVTEAGKPGLLRIKNPYMNNNYVGSGPDHPMLSDDGYFRSGDIAAWGPNKELLILGRVDQLINLGGMKIDPGQVEEVIQSVKLVSGAAVIAIPRPIMPPQLMALVTLSDRNQSDAIVNTIRTQCESRLPSQAVPRLIFVVDDIPRTDDGIPRRYQCRTIADALLSKLERNRQSQI